MDAAIIDRNDAQEQECTGYKSRPGALIWFFRKSRDRWKQKYQVLKATVKKHKNRVADANKSRASSGGSLRRLPASVWKPSNAKTPSF